MYWTIVERPTVKLFRPYYRFCKRSFDIILCLLTLPLFLIVGAIIGILIRLESPGPVLFVQERVGKGGRIFKMVKFRTMYQDISRNSHRDYMKAYINGQAESTGEDTVFKPFQANQVTKVGRFLRAASLDELPQVINIIKGDMSLIGPRPNVVWEVEEYREWHKERLEVLPGITGLAQVRGRSKISFEDIIRHDIEYVENQSVWLDLKILWWTFSSVLSGTGAQ